MSSPTSRRLVVADVLGDRPDTLDLRRDTAARVAEEAAFRRVTAPQLVSDLLDRVVLDDRFADVLDFEGKD